MGVKSIDFLLKIELYFTNYIFLLLLNSGQILPLVEEHPWWQSINVLNRNLGCGVATLLSFPFTKINFNKTLFDNLIDCQGILCIYPSCIFEPLTSQVYVFTI